MSDFLQSFFIHQFGLKSIAVKNLSNHTTGVKQEEASNSLLILFDRLTVILYISTRIHKDLRLCSFPQELMFEVIMKYFTEDHHTIQHVGALHGRVHCDTHAHTVVTRRRTDLVILLDELDFDKMRTGRDSYGSRMICIYIYYVH